MTIQVSHNFPDGNQILPQKQKNKREEYMSALFPVAFNVLSLTGLSRFLTGSLSSLAGALGVSSLVFLTKHFNVILRTGRLRVSSRSSLTSEILFRTGRLRVSLRVVYTHLPEFRGFFLRVSSRSSFTSCSGRGVVLSLAQDK